MLKGHVITQDVLTGSLQHGGQALWDLGNE